MKKTAEKTGDYLSAIFKQVRPDKLGLKAAEIAKLETYKSFLRVSNLVERIILGPLTPAVPTPSKVEFWWEKSKLIHYTSARTKKKLPTPLLIIPPLMVRPTIFDLRAGHSFVAYLRQRGIDVFIVDFGIPRKEDKVMAVDDYILDFIPKAVEKIRQKTGCKEISMLGWSMGGIMTACYVALNGKDSRVKNEVIIGSPIDYSKMFPINILAKISNVPLRRFIDLIGNVPGFVSSAAFRLMSPLGLMRRYAELAVNYWDREYIAGFEALEKWMKGFIPYPAEAFMQFAEDFIKDDKLKALQVEMGGKVVDLKNIKISTLVISGEGDFIAPQPSCDALLDFISSTDKKVIHVSHGHLGLVAGSGSPATVWQPVADWLVERS